MLLQWEILCEHILYGQSWVERQSREKVFFLLVFFPPLSGRKKKQTKIKVFCCFIVARARFGFGIHKIKQINVTSKGIERNENKAKSLERKNNFWLLNVKSESRELSERSEISPAPDTDDNEKNYSRETFRLTAAWESRNLSRFYLSRLRNELLSWGWKIA